MIIEKIKSMFDVSFIDSVYKLLVFGDLLRVAFPSQMKRYIRNTRKRQQQTLTALKGKPKITVAFFLQTPSTWKLDALYRRLQQAERFKPVVVICPYNLHLNYSKMECLRVMEQTVKFAQSRGYSYVSMYDEKRKRWLDVKKAINPDAVFFTKPYKDTAPQCYIYRFREKLTCYTGYGYNAVSTYDRSYNLPLHNLLHHHFVENDFLKQLAQQNSTCKGDNLTVASAVGMEALLRKDYAPRDVWKPQATTKKRIIWAPHHTLDYLFCFGTFLTYCSAMLDLAKKYESSVQLAFKPHPVLKFRLINMWGQQKTDEYYRLWQQMPNTQLEEGDYSDLFLTSDALIHDGATFTIEYLHTKKPAMFLVKNEKIKTEWNPFGLQAFNLHYHAHSAQEVEDFIRQVALGGSDPKAPAREAFYAEYLYPKDGIMPSEKIYTLLEEETK